MSSTCIPTAAVVADKSSTAVTAVTAAASATTSSSLSLRRKRRHSFSNVVFPLSSNPNLPHLSQSSRSSYTRAVTAKSQLNNAGFGGSSTGAVQSKSEAPAKEIKNGKPSSESVPTQLSSQDSISEFITQVANLVKLVDSRDIVELEMKQHDCELLIRKKEAISQTSPPLVPTMQSPPTPPAAPQTSPPAPTSSAAPAASPAPTLPAAKPAKSSVPLSRALWMGHSIEALRLVRQHL